MTLGKAIADVYRNLGDPRSDLPTMTLGAVDLTLQGAQDIRDYLTSGLDAIATWTGPGGRKLKFRGMQDSVTAELLTVSGTLATQASPYKTIVLPAGFGTTADRYANWVADFGSGVYRRVLRNPVVAGVSSIVLDRALSANPAGLTLTLRQRILRIGAGADDVAYAGRAVEIVKVIDLEAGAELERSGPEDLVLSGPASVASPSSYEKFDALAVALDSAPPDARSFELVVYRYPLARTLVTEELPLPTAFHPPAVLYATFLGFLRLNETAAAYAFRRNFEDTVARLQTEYDLEDRSGGDYLAPGRRT